MLKQFLIFAVIIMVFGFMMTPVYAVYNPDMRNVLNPTGIEVPGNIEDVGGIVNIITEIVKWTYTIFFIVAVFMILMAAYTYLTAQADPEKIKNATKQITWAAVAIAVALIAVSVNLIVKQFIGGGTGTGGGKLYENPMQNLNLPQ